MIVLIGIFAYVRIKRDLNKLGQILNGFTEVFLKTFVCFISLISVNDSALGLLLSYANYTWTDVITETLIVYCFYCSNFERSSRFCFELFTCKS